MKTVAISQLKATLSRQLAIVKAGEEVIVTERGRPVARLIPISEREQAIPGHLLAMERAGLIRIGEGNIPDEFWRTARPKDDKAAARGALVQEREDGR